MRFLFRLAVYVKEATSEDEVPPWDLPMARSSRSVEVFTPDSCSRPVVAALTEQAV